MILFGGDGGDGTWGALAIVGMLLAPCVIGRALYVWDRWRERRAAPTPDPGASRERTAR